jgi:type IV pilus biogenesis protein CpaD/CtpE
MKNLSVWLLGLACVAGAGCFSRAHMSEHYGRAYKDAFARQVANPGSGASAKAPKGLDAIEAGAVVDNYRAQLAPHGGGGNEQQQMILLSPQAGSLGYAAPSAAASAPGK